MIQLDHNRDTNQTKISTEHGSYTLPTPLFELFASCDEPQKVVDIVDVAKERGYSSGYVRSVVQALSQPGQYQGSPCIGFLNTSCQGKRLFVQVAHDGVRPAREKLTRRAKTEGQ